MPPSSTVVAPRESAHVEIAAVEWRRIQVVVRLRPAPGVDLEPRSIALHRSGSPDQVMPPTHAAADGRDVVVRFNVLQGPGQQPLAPGRWRLVAADAAGASVPLAGADGLDVAQLGRAFEVHRGVYVVEPFLDPDGALGLDVRLEPFAVGLPRRLLERWSEAASGLLGRGHVFRLLVGLVRRLRPRDGRRILFASDSRSALGGNLALVHARMIERGLDREYELLTLFKPTIAVRRSLSERVRLVWRLARADVIVIDDYHPVIYRLHGDGTPVVQLWHAVGAFKTVGYSRVGKLGAPDPWSTVHKNYSHAIVSAASDVEFYAEAFGIPEARVVPTGVPRVDRFFDADWRAAAVEATLRDFPAARDRTRILFAPTFRGPGAKQATFPLDRLDLAALHALCVERDAVCLIRLHPFVREPLEVPEPFRDRLLDGSATELDVNELLCAIDLLITDYSSIVFEFSTLNRPMLFYAWDLDEYVASRDFYIDYEAFVPGRIVRTFDELLAAIRAGDFEADKVPAFAAHHFDHLDGGSTDRVVDLILGA